MKFINTIILSLIFIALHITYAYPTIEISSVKLTTNDGLCNNNVRYIYQDSKGFIWISTLNGLSRYDSNSFITYRPEGNNSLSLADLRVGEITEDSNGFLWIYTVSQQFSCYNLRNNRFVDFTGNGEYEQKYSDKLITSTGNIWLWHDKNGCRKISYENETFSSVSFNKEQNNLSDNNVHNIIEGAGGNIWIATAKGLNRIDKNNDQFFMKHGNFSEMTTFGNRDFFISYCNEIMCYDENENIIKILSLIPYDNIKVSSTINIDGIWYIMTNQGIIRYDLNADKFLPGINRTIVNASYVKDNKSNYWLYNMTGRLWRLSKEGVTQCFDLIPNEKLGYIDRERFNIIVDNRGLTWISTYGNGIFVYNDNTESIQHITSNREGSGLLGSDYLLFLTEDNQGGIWTSSEFTGISILKVLNEGTKRIFPDQHYYTDRSNAVRMISKTSDDDIWIATRSGSLYCYDSDLNLQRPKENYKANIYAVEKDDDGLIWKGSRGGGLYIDDKLYLNQINDSCSLGFDHIFCFHKDKKGRMWIGTFGNGLDLAYKENGTYKFRHFLNTNYGQRQIRDITEDDNGYLWIGTSDGIYIIDPDSIIENPDRFLIYNTENNKLRSNEVKCIFKDKKGNMYISTAGEGFSVCHITDYESLEFRHYSTKDGLVNDIVYSITEDNSNYIWLATEFGISRFYPERGTFANYFFSSYFMGNVYSENCCCNLSDGNILFGTNHGFIVLDPDKLNTEIVSPDVSFTSLKVNGLEEVTTDAESLLENSISYTDNLDLEYSQNSFCVDFSIFDYEKTDLVKYTFILDNYDREWSIPSSINFAAYKNLSPGEYKLRVKACNSIGIWSENEAVLHIKIHPPFWKTYWAFIFYLITAVILIYLMLKLYYNFNSLRQKIALENQMTEFKLSFFTNITHEFRTPLTLIQCASEKLAGIRNMPGEALLQLKTLDKSTGRMLRLVNQILEFRKMQNNKLKLVVQETDIISFVYEIYSSFTDSAIANEIDYRFRSEKDMFKVFIDKGHVEKITYNLISNAFKYTPRGGIIEIDIYINHENFIVIRVCDNGVGIAKDKQPELFSSFMQSNFSTNSMGIGLHLCSELVKIHNGKIWFEENDDKGSVFSYSLPVNSEVYKPEDFLKNDIEFLNDERLYLTKDDKKINLSICESLNNRKVLIIEDDNDILEFLKSEISKYFSVDTAINGAEGYKKAKENDYDLILCDVLMPEMNGFEVTHKLKNDFTTSHIPVILLTALDMREKQITGIESGADDYITKPFSLKYLILRIKNLIEQREKLKAKFSKEPESDHSTICISETDKKFIEKMNLVLDRNIADPEFSVESFASLMNLGRTVFYKKVKGITGYTPNEYIRIVRMKKGAELLKNTDMTISEIAFKIGIADPFYFSKCFKSQFGVSPSLYQKEN